MKYIEDAVDDARREREREKARKRRKSKLRNANWGDIIGGTLFAAFILAMVSGFVWVIYYVATIDGKDQAKVDAHYKKDFTTFCKQINGKPDTSDSEAYYCYGPEKKILMYSGNDGYNSDFKRFCEDRGGKAVISTRDLCTKDGRELMRESKWDDPYA